MQTDHHTQPTYLTLRGTQRQFSENFCSEDELRSVPLVRHANVSLKGHPRVVRLRHSLNCCQRRSNIIFYSFFYL